MNYQVLITQLPVAVQPWDPRIIMCHKVFILSVYLYMMLLKWDIPKNSYFLEDEISFYYLNMKKGLLINNYLMVKGKKDIIRRYILISQEFEKTCWL